jgi:hypothetical protein
MTDTCHPNIFLLFLSMGAGGRTVVGTGSQNCWDWSSPLAVLITSPKEGLGRQS